MSRYGAARTSSGTRASCGQPLAPDCRRLVLVEGEVDRARVRETDGLGPVEGTHRRGVRAGDEDPHGEGAPARSLVHRRDVGDDHSRLGQESQLEGELERVPRLLRQRPAAELLGDDDRDEVGLAAREPPDLLEDGVDPAAFWIERLEQRGSVREVEPAWADPGVAAVARDVDRAEPVRRDRPSEGERALGGRVEILDDEQRAVAGAGRRRDGGSSGAQPASDPRVMAPHAEHREDEHRDRDGDEPGALGELRPDHDHGDEARWPPRRRR